MMINRCLRLAAAAALTGLLVGACGSSGASGGGGSGGGGSAAAKSVTIDLDYEATPSPQDPWNHLATTWQSMLSKASNGRIKVKLFPGGQLSDGNQTKEVTLVQNGTINAAIFPSSILGTFDARFYVVGMPWMVPNQKAADTLMDGPLGAQTVQWVDADNLHALAIGSNGFRQLANSKHPVSTPADVKGLKLRVPGTEDLVQTWQDLGAQPTTLDFTELYTALQEGTVDGEELPLPYKVSTKYYDVEKYVTIMNYSFDTIYLTLSRGTWSSLSPADQKLVTSTAAAAMKNERAFEQQAATQAVKILESHSMKITTLTPQEVSAFQQKVAPVYSQMASKIGQSTLDTWRNELSKITQ